MYLDRIRVLYQDAFGQHEVLMIISTVEEGPPWYQVMLDRFPFFSIPLETWLCNMHNAYQHTRFLGNKFSARNVPAKGAFWSSLDPSTRKRG